MAASIGASCWRSLVCWVNSAATITWVVVAAAAPMCRSSASANTANPGLWSIDRHTIATSRPPGTSTLAISASAAARSGKNCKPSWQHTTSKLPSGNGNRPAVACTQPIGAPPSGKPGHHPRTARRIQHPLTLRRGRHVQDPWCPRPKDRRDQLALVDLGGTTRHLPLLVAHAASSSRLRTSPEPTAARRPTHHHPRTPRVSATSWYASTGSGGRDGVAGRSAGRTWPGVVGQPVGQGMQVRRAERAEAWSGSGTSSSATPAPIWPGRSGSPRPLRTPATRPSCRPGTSVPGRTSSIRCSRPPSRPPARSRCCHRPTSGRSSGRPSGGPRSLATRPASRVCCCRCGWPRCQPPGLLATRVYIDLVDLDQQAATERLLAGVRAWPSQAAGSATLPGRPGYDHRRDAVPWASAGDLRRAAAQPELHRPRRPAASPAGPPRRDQAWRGGAGGGGPRAGRGGQDPAGGRVRPPVCRRLRPGLVGTGRAAGDHSRAACPAGPPPWPA